MERKSFLKAFVLAAAAGPIVVDSCKKDSANSSGSSSTSTNTTDSSCIVTPTEVEGPYPYPGGELTNPLERSNITESQTGVPLTLTINVVNADSSCAIVQNARVDIWHCNKDGYYSGYANQTGILGTEDYTGKTFLRGYQLSDSSGQVKFVTIYPGWYSGRTTHIHFEVYLDGVLKKTTQIAFPDATNTTVDTSSLYASLGVNPITNADDSILGNSSTDLAHETVTLSGSVSAGYTGTYTIGLAL